MRQPATEVKENQREDGGYYAIKGFAYQIDKAILEILNSENDELIGIEKIQDIDAEDFVIQVKYKETQQYSNGKIKEPVIQLIEEFRCFPDKKYKLYCYFNNKNEGVNDIDLDSLNAILKPIEGDSAKSKKINDRLASIDDSLKKSFLKNFELIFAPEFQDQFENIVKELKKTSAQHISNDEAVLYYSWIVHYILNKVTNVAGGSDFKKSELISLINEGKNIVFSTAYDDYLGHEAYLSLVEKRFLKPNKKKTNFIYVGCIEEHSSVTFSQMILGIVENYFYKATYDIQPLNLIIRDEYIDHLKKELCEKGEKFNDGYEHISFNPLIFSDNPIFNKKTKGRFIKKATDTLSKISFRIRLITNATYQQFEADIDLSQDMAYVLGEDMIIEPGVSYQVIQGLDTKELLKLFTN